MVEKSSTEILDAAAKAQDDRAKSRDTPEGERSMRRCVEAFNALEGTNLTEAQGWRFMAVLKLARATAGGFNLDDYVDGASYFSLAGEAAAKNPEAPTPREIARMAREQAEGLRKGCGPLAPGEAKARMPSEEPELSAAARRFWGLPSERELDIRALARIVEHAAHLLRK